MMSETDSQQNEQHERAVAAALAATKHSLCSVTPESLGCSWSMSIEAFTSVDPVHGNGVETWMQPVRAFVESPAFTKFCTESGLVQPSVEWNARDVVESSPFWAACFKLRQQSYRLGLVFHGTGPNNIAAILKNGLDPSKRKGQAYGIGEYFSKDPSVSVSYCAGGKKMLLFLVILPRKSDTKELDDEAKVQKPAFGPPTGVPTHPLTAVPTHPATAFAFRQSIGRHTDPPIDYVVVSQTTHQLPLGVVQFQNVEQSALCRSQRMRTELQRLNQEALQKQRLANEAEIKAAIIQLLFLRSADVASEKYNKHMGGLSHTSKREISFYVHTHLDVALHPILFPELPDPYSAEELQQLKMETVEKQQADAHDAWTQLQDRLHNFTGN